MQSKSTGYKVFWAGRYLERLENIARVGLFLSMRGDEELLKSSLSVDDIKGYVEMEFNMMREDMRNFVDENVMASLSYLERAVFSDSSGEKYYKDLLQSVLAVGSAIEGFMAPSSNSAIPKKQEEVREEDRK